ncbi:unnamed protein product [Linum tenue]|uniref:Uncharacterized protein n=1 Tax=Linum tenue TaxID=586396 RepID=A0AAV0HB11_9ROSI|nr:unnamed protein product [Linum tenue]
MSGMVILARLSSIYSVCSESAGVAGKAFLLLLPSSSSRSSDELELQWFPTFEFWSGLKMSVLLVRVFALFASIAFVSLRFLDSHTRQLSIGYISVFSLIFMFASPVFIIGVCSCLANTSLA